MLIDSLNVLAATKPTNFFHTARANAARIAALEKQLGLTVSAPIWNILKAKTRINDLVDMIAVSANKPALSESDQRLSAEISRLTAERAVPTYAKVVEQAAPVVAAAALRGRAKFLASVKVEQTGPVGIDPNLRGRARFVAAMKTI